MTVTAPVPTGGLGPAAVGGQAGSVVPPGASRAPADPLQAFYESPGTPLSSGPDRARRQALMLSGILRNAAGPALILDVGCGDGSALAVAARQNPGHRFAGIDWSEGALRRFVARPCHRRCGSPC